ncbi:ATP-binding protein [Litoribrevibacter albus]|uniref:Sensory/regulatory protein RpfC n=1 Tax=Litoribrevibacter albus TaxID=1473156 RepID=A0AA37SCD5_9GAMM|nr:ATP-binding protein [Litoribrevibacter albus]GLQ32180.1 hypothetical protein GCM10007876_26590 [Litoribrevibacter albus]
MNWFNNLKIRYKLALIVLLPSITLLAFSIKAIEERYNVYQDFSTTATDFHAIDYIYSIVSGLQTERTLSRVYQITENQTYQEALLRHRKVVDNAIHQLEQFVKRSEISKRFKDPRSLDPDRRINDPVNDLNQLIFDLESMRDVRAGFDNKNPNSDYFYFFSDIIQTALYLVKAITATNHDLSVLQKTNVSNLLARIEEQVSLETAHGLTFMSSPGINNDENKFLQTNMLVQNALYDDFHFELATEKQKNMLYGSESQTTSQKINELRDQMLNLPAKLEIIQQLEHIFQTRSWYNLCQLAQEGSEVSPLIRSSSSRIFILLDKYRFLSKTKPAEHSPLRALNTLLNGCENIESTDDAKSWIDELKHSLESLKEAALIFELTEWYELSKQKSAHIHNIRQIISQQALSEIIDLSDSARHQLVRYIIVTLLAIIGSLWLGYLLVSRASNTLGSINKTLSSYAKSGHFSNKVSVYGNDEISEVALHLNQVIDERESMNIALEHSETKFLEVCHASSEPIFLIRNHEIIDYNHSGANLLKADEDRINGANLGQLLIAPHMNEPERIKEINQLIDDASSNGSSHKELNFLAPKQDDISIIHISLISMVFQGENIIYCVCKDVTAQKRAEKALIESKRAAEAANKTKSMFLANMSHELRTPMNGILGMASLLQKTELNSEQNEYVSTINNSASTLLNILNDILDFSKIEAGKLQIEILPFNLVRLVEDVSALLNIKAAEKGINLDTRIQPDLPEELIGDYVRIKQIILNLCSNAIKFTEQGHVMIHVKRDPSVQVRPLSNKVPLVIEVVDTGYGINNQKLNDIFRVFTQEDSSTTRRFGGTGLGLTISRQLAELMGGKISVESIKGHGSTFSLHLPLAAPKGAPELFSRGLMQGQHICLACQDDNELDSLKEIFRHFGASVHPVKTNEQLDQLFAREDEVSKAISLIHISDDFDYQCINSEMEKLTPMHPSMWVVFANSAQNDLLPEPLITDYFDGCYSKIYRYSILEAMLQRLTIKQDTQKQLLTKADLTEKDLLLDSNQSTKEANFAISVLLVEDNPVNQRVATRILEKLGCTVDLAEDGTKALEMFHHNYDVILMDCQMPVMDGFEATRNIRAREANLGGKNLIIALTANTIEGDKKKCIEAGMDDFIPKPVTMNALEELLSKYFNHQQEPLSNTL